MAVEIFDDVAFFYVLVASLALVLVPITIYLVWNAVADFLCKTPANKNTIPGLGSTLDGSIDVTTTSKQLQLLTDAKKKKEAALNKPKGLRKILSVKWILFIVGWIFLIYLLSQSSNYQTEGMASFDPYGILELDSSAPEKAVKAAYRQLSLKYHPDKNPGDAEAEAKFMLVRKAYEVLTDEDARANMEQFGNVDGKRGVSKVAIGLPVYLTKKENEKVILLAYLLLIFLVPSVLVVVWWRKAKTFHETGALTDSIIVYYRCITEQMSVKYLIEILAASAEYRVIEKTPLEKEEFRRLMNEVKDEMIKQKFPHVYIIKASHLLHAYMLRLTLTPFQQADLKVILKDAHRLMHTMLEMCLQRQWIKASFSVIELMQLVTQALWVHDSALRQLPHLTDKEIKFAAKKNLHEFGKFRRTSDADKRKVFRERTDEEWEEIRAVAALLPNIDVQYKYEVEDETGIYEDDLLCLTVDLKRKNFLEDESKKDSKEDETTPAVTAAVVASDKPESAIPGSLEPQPNGNGDKAAATEKKGTGEGEEEDDEEGDEDDEEEDDDKIFALAQKPEEKRNDAEAPDVHSPLFPFPKKERWYAILLQLNPKEKDMIVGYQRLPNFGLTDSVKLRWRAPKKGLYSYELHIKCDSYIGCDVVTPFKIRIDAHPPEDTTKEKKELTPVEEKEKEEPYEGKWYYCGLASFWEFVLHIIFFLVVGFFLMDWLQKKGYWQVWFQPILDKVAVISAPVVGRISILFAPLIQFLDRITTRTYHRDEQPHEEQQQQQEEHTSKEHTSKPHSKKSRSKSDTKAETEAEHKADL